MRKFGFFLLWSMCLMPIAALAQSVTLTFDLSDQRWVGYPDNEGQIQSHWDGNTLLVSTIVDVESGTAIDPSSAKVVIRTSRDMSICYKKNIVHQDSGQPALASTSPVILRFTVTDVPKQNYKVTISHNCKD